MLYKWYFQVKNFIDSLKERQEEGQGLIEYALIIVLIAIVVIAALLVLGPTIANVFNRVSNNLATVP
mgnify:CR=1 FL=1